MDIQFGNLTSLNLLWVIAGLVGLMLFAAVQRRRALRRFATLNLVQRLTAGISGPRRVVKAVLITLSLMLLAVALTDPRWGKAWREVPQKGIDVMFVVDVSRSMLAEDATPSRLERARQQIGDMLEAMHGDRVGLVAFAGDAKQVSPLTTNYHDFKQSLRTIGPHSVIRGGSRLGDALTLAAQGFLDQTDDHKAIVVFTDGEDQESHPLDVARQLHDEQGIRIFTIGLGDMRQGARIPIAHHQTKTEWLQHDGEQVWSKMNGDVLKQVAQAADGAWIPAGTKQVDMADVYRSYVGSIEQTEFETARIHSYIPRHQWFIGAALLLLVIETLLSDRRRVLSAVPIVSEPLKSHEESRPQNTSRRGQLVASLLVLSLFNLGAASPSRADDGSSLVAQANAALDEGDYQTAIDQYRQAAAERPDRWEPIYNEAVAQYRKGDLQAARELFTRSLSSPDRSLEAKARFNLANCDYAEAVATAEQDKDAAIAKLESAIDHYRGALTANSSDSDARINIELAGRLMDQLRQENQQQQQQQNKQQSDESQQSQNDEQNQKFDQNQDSQQSSDDQQSSDSESNDAESQDQQQADSQQSDNGQSSEEQSNETQDDPNSQTGQSDEQAKPSQEQQPSDEGDSSQADEESQHQDDQPESERATDNPQNAEPQSGQPETEEPQEQQESGQSSSHQSQETFGQQANSVPQYGHSSAQSETDDAQPMTQIEAEKMLQAVRDRDLRRRLQRLQAERLRAVTVDRDW